MRMYFRVVRMAEKYFAGDTSVNYVEVWDIADEYHIHRDDITAHAMNLSMMRLIEEAMYARA